MSQIGQHHTLAVVKIADFGYFLDAGELGEVLLPRKLAPAGLSVGDKLEVFLYLDSEDRPIATTKKPKACVGEFAYLQVVATTDVGAFLDWGLEKDVLVPFAEQHRPMEVGRSYLVYVYLSPSDGRIMASSKIDKFIDEDEPHDFHPQQAVSLIIANSTLLGYKTIINHQYWGVLHNNDVHERLSFGQYKRGFIKRIRPDGKIDISLQGGQETRDKYADTIIRALNKADGFLALHDKSDPEAIKQQLSMSKAAFKKAIGSLYKQQRITIEKDGIRLN